MKLFDELPSVLPWFDTEKKQIRFRENNSKVEIYKLYCPNDRFLPFLIKLPKDSPKPEKWFMIDLFGIKTDISHNIPILKALNFNDATYGYYDGSEIQFKRGDILEPLNLCGYYYLELVINNKSYFSEILYLSKKDNLLKIEFWNDGDIEPLRYRNEFHQKIYLDTFLHTSEPAIEEEGERDGDNKFIPTFVKMTIKQKAEAIVPDFVKIALSTLQLHDNIKVSFGTREGIVDRVEVTSQVDETGAYSSVIMDFETEVLSKKTCDDDLPALNSNYW